MAHEAYQAFTAQVGRLTPARCEAPMGSGELSLLGRDEDYTHHVSQLQQWCETRSDR